MDGLLCLKRSLQRQAHMWACELLIKSPIRPCSIFACFPSSTQGSAVSALTEML